MDALAITGAATVVALSLVEELVVGHLCDCVRSALREKEKKRREGEGGEKERDLILPEHEVRREDYGYMILLW